MDFHHRMVNVETDKSVARKLMFTSLSSGQEKEIGLLTIANFWSIN